MGRILVKERELKRRDCKHLDRRCTESSCGGGDKKGRAPDSVCQKEFAGLVTDWVGVRPWREKSLTTLRLLVLEIRWIGSRHH